MSSKQKYNIFLSYQWNIQNEVLLLYTFLTSKGYKVWMDMSNIKIGRELTKELVHGILDSELFIACINKDYVKSDACSSEIHYANGVKKPILPLMFEKLKAVELKDVGFITLKLVYLELFKDESVTKTWSGPMSVALIDSIKNALNIERTKQSIYTAIDKFTESLSEEKKVANLY